MIYVMEQFLLGLKNKLKAIQATGTELQSSLCELSWTSSLVVPVIIDSSV